MESKESPILQGLNPAQRDAVVNYDSPSLIIAGAGSGKTRVLTSRIAYMIEQGIKPWNILALTFTNKAAESMRERIAQMLPDNRSRYIRMGTFHSVFSRILRENAEKIGFTDSFTIYEPSDCKNLLKTIVRELNLPDEKYKPNVLSSRISYAKNCLVTPGAYLANSTCAAEDRQAQIPEFGNIYNIYCQRCKRNGAMDFDDLLLQTNILLRDCPDVLARYQEQFQYILVDEYQDTNYAQYTIIRRLSQIHSKVCVVGDDAQSIYSFRGAKIENILSFKKDYPSAMVFKLEQNYRSTQTIVDAANSVIVRNSKRMEKHCFSEGDVGDKIRILKAYTDREEAEMVVTDLRDKVRAERITGGRVIGAFPGKGRFGQRRYAKQYREIAARYIGNAAINYFEPSRRPNILNILSTEAGDGKSTISEQVAAYLREADMKVRVISWNKDFDVEQKSYLLAGKLEDFVQDRPGDLPLCEADVVLVEYPPFSDKSVPKELLRNAALNIVIAPANRTWKDTDQLLFEKTEKLAGRTPVTLCLNCARRDVVQSFTGLMPPYTRMRRLGYQISQFGFTAVK